MHGRDLFNFLARLKIRRCLKKSIKQLNKVSISVSLGLGLVLVLGLVLGLVSGLVPSSDLVMWSTVLSSSCVLMLLSVTRMIYWGDCGFQLQACQRKLDSKCEALLILSKDLDQCRQERDQFQLMAEQVQSRYQSIKRQLAGIVSHAFYIHL